MENFKGTKGQWFVDGEHITTGYDNLSETICDINPNTEYPSVHERSVLESKYNAQLIAHAPEMLEMLGNVNNLFIRRALPSEREVKKFARDIQDLLTRATTI